MSVRAWRTDFTRHTAEVLLSQDPSLAIETMGDDV